MEQWKYCSGTSINDVQFFGSLLKPLPPSVQFAPSNVKCFGFLKSDIIYVMYVCSFSIEHWNFNGTIWLSFHETFKKRKVQCSCRNYSLKNKTEKSFCPIGCKINDNSTMTDLLQFFNQNMTSYLSIHISYLWKDEFSQNWYEFKERS